MSKRHFYLFERLLDTDVKADVLTLLHNNAGRSETPEQIAIKVGRNPTEVQRALQNLVGLGVLEKVEESYSLPPARDNEVQDAISKELASGEESWTRYRTVFDDSKTGIEIIDQLLPEGLPTASTILILSDPGAGEKNLVAQLVGKRIVDKESVLYVTMDNFPPNIRKSVLQNIQWTGKEAVDWSLLTFVDSYSSTVGVESQEEFNAKWEPSYSDSITKLLSEILEKKEITMIVFDSLNTVIRKLGLQSSIEILRVLVARTRQAKCHTLVTMNRKAFHPAIVATAEDVVDGVLELKVEEGSKEVDRFLRILKMNDTRHSTAWKHYEISKEGIFETKLSN